MYCPVYRMVPVKQHMMIRGGGGGSQSGVSGFPFVRGVGYIRLTLYNCKNAK